MSVSAYLDSRQLFPERRVFTAPIRTATMPGVAYLNPDNLNEKILEEDVDFCLPGVIPEPPPHAPARHPSENLTIHMNYVPLQYLTEGPREGSSRFNACVNMPMPKLRTPADKVWDSYMKSFSRDDISLKGHYAKTGDYPYHNNSPDQITAMMLDTRPLSISLKHQAVSEPTGIVYKHEYHGREHRQQNAPPQTGMEELEYMVKSGQWY
jgi:hypothetical protein